MRGHQPLIAMRLRGITPADVLIWVGTDALRCWRDWPRLMPQHAAIEISPRDRLSALPPLLRCVVGMFVHVGGEDLDRTWTVAEMCADADAARVLAMWHAPKPADSIGIWIDRGANQWQQF